MSKPKIDLMIIGAQKAGTTSLLRYLGEHPECISHPQKEFAYFLNPDSYNNDVSSAFNKYFPEIKKDKKLIAKSATLYTSDEALKLLHKHNPNCNLVIILRNPIERTISSYLLERNYSLVDFEFSEIPSIYSNYQEKNYTWDYNFIVSYGFYSDYLTNVYKYFKPEHVHVFLYEEFESDPKKVCQTIFSKLNINDSFSPEIVVRHNLSGDVKSRLYARAVKKITRSEKTRGIAKLLFSEKKLYKYGDFLRKINKKKTTNLVVDDDTKKFFLNLFKPYNDTLEKLINKDLSDWNK